MPLPDPGPIYSAEQINVPEELAWVLKIYTKAVIRAQPANLIQFSKEYFEELLEKHPEGPKLQKK